MSGLASSPRQRPSRRVDWAHRIAKFFSRLQSIPWPLKPVGRSIAGLMEGGVVGYLREDELKEFVSQTYALHTDFYEPEKYRRQDENAILESLQDRVGPNATLLDLFCGCGREAAIFADAGFDVTGIDQSGKMIATARQFAEKNSWDADFVHSQIDQFHTHEKYDVVYTSLWMYSTIQGRRQRISLLKKCKGWLAEGGVIVISTVGRSTGGGRLGDSMRHFASRISALLTNGNWQCEIGDRIYSGLFWHHMDPDEVKDEVLESGLTIDWDRQAAGRDPSFYLLVEPNRQGSSQDQCPHGGKTSDAEKLQLTSEVEAEVTAS